jgi:hypothetical protein
VDVERWFDYVIEFGRGSTFKFSAATDDVGKVASLAFSRFLGTGPRATVPFKRGEPDFLALNVDLPWVMQTGKWKDALSR